MNQRMDNVDKNGFDIEHQLTINASIEKVYQAISEPVHLVNWWPLHCKGVPTIGEEYNFYFAPEYDWYGVVCKIDHPHSFHIRMTKSDADWDSTVFGFDLHLNNNLTAVDFKHTGWPVCNEHYKRSAICWKDLLEGLKNYVEKAIIIPFEERS